MVLDDEHLLSVTRFNLEELEEKLLVLDVVEFVVLGQVVLDTCKLVLHEVFQAVGLDVHMLHVGLAHHVNFAVVPIKTLLDHFVLGAEQI